MSCIVSPLPRIAGHGDSIFDSEKELVTRSAAISGTNWSTALTSTVTEELLTVAAVHSSLDPAGKVSTLAALVNHVTMARNSNGKVDALPLTRADRCD